MAAASHRFEIAFLLYTYITIMYHNTALIWLAQCLLGSGNGAVRRNLAWHGL